MKRTRRIEVIRYTRRVTLSEGAPAADDTAAEQPASGLLLDALAVVPPTPEPANSDDSAGREPAGDDPPRRRLPSWLGDLLRPRG